MITAQKNDAPAKQPAKSNNSTVKYDSYGKRIDDLEKMFKSFSKDLFMIKQQLKQLQRTNANRN